MVWNGLFLAHFTFLWLQSHSRVKNFSSLFILRLVLRSRKRKIDWGISGVALGQGPQNSFPNQRALRRNAHCRKMDKRGCSVPSTLARVSHRDCQRSFSLPIWWALIRRRSPTSYSSSTYAGRAIWPLASASITTAPASIDDSSSAAESAALNGLFAFAVPLP